MTIPIAGRISFALLLLFFCATASEAVEQKIGVAVSAEGVGFLLNHLVTKIVVREVTKGTIAEAAGMRLGDLILQIEGQNVAGRRASALMQFQKINPGETRKFRVKHTDGTEADVRITKPKT